jgi:chromosome partitioning protein
MTCAWEGVPASFDLIPGSLDEMADVEVQLMALQMREQRLARALAPLRRQYDVLLLDCPPNLSLLTTNALWAADKVLVPVQAQDKAVRQLPKILGSITDVQGFRDGPPGVLGFVLTMADRRATMSGDVDRALREAYGEEVFATVIPFRTRQAEDARWNAPVALYAPKDGAAAYSTLAQEVLARAHT